MLQEISKKKITKILYPNNYGNIKYIYLFYQE